MPEPRFDRVVSPLFRSDRPGTARIVRTRLERIVPTLAEAASDRVNRRQIEHVEAERGDVGQEPGCLAERRAAPGIGASRPRKHLVPGAEAGAHPFDRDLQRAVVAGSEAPIRPPHHGAAQRLRQCPRHTHLDRLGRILQRRGRLLEQAAIGLDDPSNDCGALEQLARDLLAGAELFRQLVPPGFESVHPGFYGVFVLAELGHPEVCAPAIVADMFHCDFGPVLLARTTGQQRGDNDIVSIGVHVRRDHDILANRTFDGKPAAVDLRTHGFDDDAPLQVRIERAGRCARYHV